MNPPSPPAGPARWLAPVTGAIAALALAGPALVVADPPRIPRPRPVAAAPARVVPAAELPPVEPVAFQNLPPDEARAWNAAVPFSTDPNPAARPFRISAAGDDRTRAIDCMAAAMLYEAGDDPVGERAVGQVVINRVRHPAFPKSICGVVFQGQERTTGCQFTFTCDGAMARLPDPDAWVRARVLAEAALSGAVFARVGHATHYHTDWVVPYWSASLDKVAAVHTHLFFRWTGWWGTPPAFRRTVSDREPAIAQLAALSPAHALAGALDDAAGAVAAADALLAAQAPAADAAGADGTFLLTLDRRLPADQYAAFARATCGARDYCKLLAWTAAKDTPPALPATAEQMGRMAFSYLRDRAKGFDKPLWNCAAARRANPRECMKVQFALPAAGAAATPTPGAAPTPAPAASAIAAEPLAGIRRGARPAAGPGPGPATGAAPAAGGSPRATPPGTPRPATP